MKILIVATYYPPDTAIAAVRPYMLAKYLTRLGHSVTVLRSGEINNRCENFFEKLPEVRVISYLGEACPAEAFARGEWKAPQNQGKSRIDFLPEVIRFPVARTYHFLMRHRKFSNLVEKRYAYLEKQKAALNALKDEAFDLVFATVGEFENALAGQYASELFSCPLIQDFRDPLAVRAFQNKREYAFWKKIQDDAVQKADACTAVSNGVLQKVCSNADKAVVLYNGYEPTDAHLKKAVPSANQLRFCYTGQLYKGLQDFSPLLKALRCLSKQGKISLDNVQIHYAGNDFDYLHQQAQKIGVAEVLTNHGYVDRKEAARIQAGSDIFMVLSWNTDEAKGILTGKFYEGIRAGKPILSLVAGNVPGSELSLINEKYHYGFCYESCQKNQQFQQLCDYLEKAYQKKMSTGSVGYTPDPTLASDFRYDTLAQKLEGLCLQLLEEKSR